MGERECICGASEPCRDLCGKHGRLRHGYPCGECGREWEAANPATAAAISALAEGRGSTAALAKARIADAKRPTPPPVSHGANEVGA